MTELLILNFIQSVVVRRNSGVVDLLETNHDRVPNARLIDRNHFAVVVEPVRFRAQDLHLGTSRRADLRRFRLLRRRGVTLLNSVEKENSLSVKTKNTFPATASRRDARKNPGATRTTRPPRASFSFFVHTKGGGRFFVSSSQSQSRQRRLLPKKFITKKISKKRKNFVLLDLVSRRRDTNFSILDQKIALETLGKIQSSSCFLIFFLYFKGPGRTGDEGRDDSKKQQAEKEEEKIKKKRIAWRRGGRQRERDDVAHLRSDFERRSLRRLFSVNDGVPASEETRG